VCVPCVIRDIEAEGPSKVTRLRGAAAFLSERPLHRLPVMNEALPQLAGVEHRFVELSDIRVHVAEAGTGDPVVLLHGWPQNWWEWRRLLPRLAERFRVICPDTRGFGWSDAPTDDYDKETIADDMLALFDQMELGRVRLIGHDVGGFVAFLICLRAPDRVASCLTLNTGHPFVRPTPAALGTFWRFWYWPMLGAPLLGPWLVRHGIFQKLLHGWFTTGRADWSSADESLFLGGLAEPRRSLASSKTYRSYLVKDSPRTLFGKYRSMRLKVPTLMLHGIEDRILREPFLRGYEPFAEEMSVELVPDAGHFIAEERPEFVAARALSFFSQ
jgi:pimeloyl-ACP methyl ester carboxylesterase